MVILRNPFACPAYPDKFLQQRDAALPMPQRKVLDIDDHQSFRICVRRCRFLLRPQGGKSEACGYAGIADMRALAGFLGGVQRCRALFKSSRTTEDLRLWSTQSGTLDLIDFLKVTSPILLGFRLQLREL